MRLREQKLLEFEIRIPTHSGTEPESQPSEDEDEPGPSSSAKVFDDLQKSMDTLSLCVKNYRSSEEFKGLPPEVQKEKLDNLSKKVCVMFEQQQG